VRRATTALTLPEVLVALAILAVVISAILPLFPSAIVSDANSRSRSRAITAAETWLDRNRAGQEPTTATGPCAITGASVVCTYAYGHDFATDGVGTHADGADALRDMMTGLRAVTTLTLLSSGTNSNKWQLKASVSWRQRGGESRVDLTTRFTR